MSNSTGDLQTWRPVSATDVLKKSADLNDSEYLVSNLHRNPELIPDAWHSPRRTERFAFADCQHATNRALLRGLGRTEPNATAAPEARLWSNQYNEDQATRLESRVRGFLSYSKDWDGDGAEEIPLSAIYDALNFLDEFRRRFSGSEPRSAAPSPDGEIAMYWHGSTGYAEINFGGAGRVSMCRVDDSDEIELIEEGLESVAEPDTSGIWAVLSEFLGKQCRQQR